MIWLLVVCVCFGCCLFVVWRIGVGCGYCCLILGLLIVLFGDLFAV